MRIGELARITGVSVETVRYYERRGLIDRPGKPVNGYRDYDSTIGRRILFIRKAQELGFTLEEIGELLAIKNIQDCRCGAVKEKVDQKLNVIEQKIVDLTRIKNTLLTLNEDCNPDSTIDNCPILAAIEPDAFPNSNKMET